MVNIIPLLGLGVFFFFLVTITIFIFMWLSWNIPVTVLRFTGNKQRPMIIHRRGRKAMIRSVPHLWVKGYRKPIRDFKAEHYYPSPKTKWGGLIVWEFEDGWLTPSPPAGVRFTKEQEAMVKTAIDCLNDLRPVSFEYDPDIHQKLKLKIVDDVDAEFMVEQTARQENQYSGGFLEFLSKHSTAILTVLIAIFLLTGFIVWLDKAPNMMAQCAAAAKTTVLEGLKDQAVEQLLPPG